MERFRDLSSHCATPWKGLTRGVANSHQGGTLFSMKRAIVRAATACGAFGIVLVMALAVANPQTFAANNQNLPAGTQVIGWTVNNTGISIFYSGNMVGNFPATLPNQSYPYDYVPTFQTYAQQNPTDAASMFPSGIGLTLSSNAAAVMTVFNFNPDQIGGQDIPPLTSLTSSQESFLESAGYGSQLQTWEADHSTPPASSSPSPSSSPPPPSSPPPTSAPPSSSSPPPASHTTAPSSSSTAPRSSSTASGTPSSTKAPTPVLPPVKPSLVKHPVKRAHPGAMPKSQRPVTLPRHTRKDPPHGSPGWVWPGVIVVVLGGAGVVLKLRHIL